VTAASGLYVITRRSVAADGTFCGIPKNAVVPIVSVWGGGPTAPHDNRHSSPGANIERILFLETSGASTSSPATTSASQHKNPYLVDTSSVPGHLLISLHKFEHAFATYDRDLHVRRVVANLVVDLTVTIGVGKNVWCAVTGGQCHCRWWCGDQWFNRGQQAASEDTHQHGRESPPHVSSYRSINTPFWAQVSLGVPQR
jgi:hypothetical protein